MADIYGVVCSSLYLGGWVFATAGSPTKPEFMRKVRENFPTIMIGTTMAILAHVILGPAVTMPGMFLVFIYYQMPSKTDEPQDGTFKPAKPLKNRNCGLFKKIGTAGSAIGRKIYNVVDKCVDELEHAIDEVYYDITGAARTEEERELEINPLIDDSVPGDYFQFVESVPTQSGDLPPLPPSPPVVKMTDLDMDTIIPNKPEIDVWNLPFDISEPEIPETGNSLSENNDSVIDKKDMIRKRIEQRKESHDLSEANLIHLYSIFQSDIDSDLTLKDYIRKEAIRCRQISGKRRRHVSSIGIAVPMSQTNIEWLDAPKRSVKHSL